MATFIYRCPVTGYKVQGLIADSPAEKADGQLYEPVTCTVCARIHLVNPKTGRVAGEDSK